MFVVFIEETRDDFVGKTENVLHSLFEQGNVSILCSFICHRLFARFKPSRLGPQRVSKKAFTRNFRFKSTFLRYQIKQKSSKSWMFSFSSILPFNSWWKVPLMELNLFAFLERSCHFKSSRVERLNGKSWQNDKAKEP